LLDHKQMENWLDVDDYPEDREVVPEIPESPIIENLLADK